MNGEPVKATDEGAVDAYDLDPPKPRWKRILAWFGRPFQRRKWKHRFRVNWILLMLGWGCLLTAAVMEHPFILTKAHDIQTHTSVIFNVDTIIALIQESGFALIIAWAVSYLIERRAKLRDELALNASRKQMAQDVVHAVFGLQHAPDYVRKVVETTLGAGLVRVRYQVAYTIDSLSEAEIRSLKVQAGRFVKFTQVCRYVFRNVSSDTRKYSIRYAMAVRGGALKDFSKIVQLRIDDKEYSQQEIGKSEIVKSPDKGYKKYHWTKTFSPKGECSIVVTSVTVKEFSDNELWASLHPTYEGLDMTVRINVPGITSFGIGCQTASPAAKQYERGMEAQWTIDGPILPNESVNFWWRSRADDGFTDESTEWAPQMPARPEETVAQPTRKYRKK